MWCSLCMASEGFGKTSNNLLYIVNEIKKMVITSVQQYLKYLVTTT